MLLLEPVIDIAAPDDFTLWPVAVPPPGSLLRASADMSAREVGTVMAALLPRDPDDDGGHLGITGALRAVVAAECLIVPGGLLARDTATGMGVPPSCCCGLEDWREWTSVPSGGKPWLGHNPAPWVEHLDGAVRIWPDGGMGEDLPPPGHAITAPLDAVVAQLRAAHRDMRGFLDAAERWTQDVAPDLAHDVVTKLDESFLITEDLGPPLGSAP